ncbi:B-cell antigen receptor complex-associated protein alpha chain [Xyrichtys novacula]|uniref:B-cell antigen receptor complex-associated protein alpha chain n=1 Tax=Xyrichtys novacula TaxID=13765 RepID=A0AAV1FN89_XYRNO|nr:B-cell antigen receptor complex-associated protein alpha chain [Xyrichtys novacula]
MGTFLIFLFCSFAVVIAEADVTLMADMPFLSVQLKHPGILKCCYESSKEPEFFRWYKSFRSGNKTIDDEKITDSVTQEILTVTRYCGVLTFDSVQVNNSGFYRCWLNTSRIYTHGTYLHVYKPLEKTINLRESTKNKILTAEGVLLFLSVILPAATLLCKSKRLHELEKKKVKKEEENIYQGLNLDDCCTTYDKIERSMTQCPYEDVCNIIEEEEEIQLEKP